MNKKLSELIKELEDKSSNINVTESCAFWE